MSDWNTQIIEEFRTNAGKVGGPFAGRDLLLLTSTGAKSGLPRTNPLAFIRDDGRFVIIASKAGAPSNPDWYYNLLANPAASIEVGTETFEVAATAITAGPERDRLYAAMVEVMPGFAEYQEKTDRVIPVVTLTVERAHAHEERLRLVDAVGPVHDLVAAHVPLAHGRPREGGLEAPGQDDRDRGEPRVARRREGGEHREVGPHPGAAARAGTRHGR